MIVFFITAIFLSTLSLRRATHNGRVNLFRFKRFLSTLSLRRATKNQRFFVSLQFYFYPRSPCGERQNSKCPCLPEYIHFYPRSPCGERPTKSGQGASNQRISIHALLAESDHAPNQRPYSRSRISIHALLAESDLDGTPPLTYRAISIHALLAESD